MLERGRAHPVLGPILLLVVVLLLAVVFMHLADEGWEAALSVGAICFAVATLVGPVVLARIRERAPRPPMRALRDRGPPPVPVLPAVALATATRNLPLRR